MSYTNERYHIRHQHNSLIKIPNSLIIVLLGLFKTILTILNNIGKVQVDLCLKINLNPQKKGSQLEPHILIVGYPWNRNDEPVLMTGPRPLLS